MQPSASDWSVWKDPQVAAQFRQRRMAIPGAEAQVDVMLKLIAAARAPQVVLDLGCGDGFLAEQVMLRYPQVRVVGVDGSADMLAAAQARLGPTANLIRADFVDPMWLRPLPECEFDVVVSGFAIHHTEDERKQELYREVFHLLRPEGVFVNIEHVASASPLGESLFDLTYAEHQTRWRQSDGEKISIEEVAVELRTRPDKAANRLAPVEQQLAWLRAIGFVDVDCYWKWLELAVLAGYRPGSG
jgi:ubiquinone/menaquinone biosynthesis C-methylase UbiE